MARRTAVDSTDSLPMKNKRRVSHPCWLIQAEGRQKLFRAPVSQITIQITSSLQIILKTVCAPTNTFIYFKEYHAWY